METQIRLAPIQRTVSVPLSLNHAFQRFTQGIGLWWPIEHTWAGRDLEEIGIEPRLGGMCWECGRHGFRCAWGEVLGWEPPHRLVLAWRFGADPDGPFDPARASEVELRFEPISTYATAVTMVHQGFERMGMEGGAYRERMDAPTGWNLLLRRYAHVDGY